MMNFDCAPQSCTFSATTSYANETQLCTTALTVALSLSTYFQLNNKHALFITLKLTLT